MSISQVKLQANKCHAAFENVQGQLDAKVKALNKEISILKQKYLDNLKSMEVGFKHKLDEIIWMEYFIKFQLDKVKPMDYIHKYFTHLGMQEDFLRNTVVPDMRDLNVASF